MRLDDNNMELYLAAKAVLQWANENISEQVYELTTLHTVLNKYAERVAEAAERNAKHKAVRTIRIISSFETQGMYNKKKVAMALAEGDKAIVIDETSLSYTVVTTDSAKVVFKLQKVDEKRKYTFI